MWFLLFWFSCGIIGSSILFSMIKKGYAGNFEVTVGLLLLLIGFTVCGCLLLVAMSFWYIVEEYGNSISTLLDKPIFTINSKEKNND